MPHAHSRVKVAVDVVLLVAEAVHRDPVAQGLHVGPHGGVALLDPGLDLALLLDVGRGVVPVAQTAGDVSAGQGE